MSGLDKTLASLSGFYYTDAEETTCYKKCAQAAQKEQSKTKKQKIDSNRLIIIFFVEYKNSEKSC